MPNKCPPPEQIAAPQMGGRGVRTLRSADLLQGQVEVLIEHGPNTYRLRLTRSGKLILQK
ncbi:MAG TPA: hemin uptake protein HemP [Pirellulales bacterium]|nr:hemin uptake protein HemP [Pirellulales bacterium]